jgi:hypothetical protein
MAVRGVEFLHRLVEIGMDDDPIVAWSPVARRIEGRQDCHGLACARYDDALACFDAGQQL